MNKLIFPAVLLTGLLSVSAFDLFSVDTVDLHSSDTSKPMEGSGVQKIEVEEKLLLVGNVPCNPAKQVCES